MQIDFDPEIITYGNLLEIFWQSHDPTAPAWSRQYASLIFVHLPAQKIEAEASLARLASAQRRRLTTEIRPYTGFNLAESFHQKYRLRLDPFLMKAFRDAFPDEKSLVDSTAAARVNGFLAGFGNPSVFSREVPLWGIPAEAWGRLRRIAAGRL